jgi:hypothetical protein
MHSLFVCGGSYYVLWRVFKIFDGIAKQPLKRQIATAIRTSSLFTVGTMLPGFLVSAFDAIFTDNLWSIRGFGRSCLASVVIVTILVVFWHSSIPDEWHVNIAALRNAKCPQAASTWSLIAARSADLTFGLNGEIHVMPFHSTNKVMAISVHRIDTFVMIPFLYNFGADFAALLVTRSVIRYIYRLQNVTISKLLIMFLMSIFIILIISSGLLNIVSIIMDYIIIAVSSNCVTAAPVIESIFTPGIFMEAILFPFYKPFP